MIFDTIRGALKHGESVDLDDFGSFQVRASIDDLDESLYLERILTYVKRFAGTSSPPVGRTTAASASMRIARAPRRLGDRLISVWQAPYLPHIFGKGCMAPKIEPRSSR